MKKDQVKRMFYSRKKENNKPFYEYVCYYFIRQFINMNTHYSFSYLLFLLIFLNVSLYAQVLNEIRICGNTAFSNQVLLPLIKSQWQSVIDTVQIKLDQNSLLKFYQEEGFIDVAVEYRILKRPTKSTFDLEFVIQEGELYYLGKIEVSGLDKLSKRFLLKLLDLRQGLPFSKKL